MNKVINFKTQGMQRDLSASAFNPKYAYENKNIRLTSTEDNDFFSIVNERGNKLLHINSIGDSISGTPIGQAVIDNELVLFTTGNSNVEEVTDIEDYVKNIPNIPFSPKTIPSLGTDTIYKLWFDNSKELEGEVLYSGQLGFNSNNPIEALSFYENESLKKVYWVDGINSPKVINISNKLNTWNDSSFNFIRHIALKEDISITKRSSSTGIFAPGVIQYSFSYFDKYGQESNIFYTSPLYYTSFIDRGGSPEDRINTSFLINIDNSDTSFDYIRIYSTYRTSINSTVTAKRIVDLATSDKRIVYIDKGTEGDLIDPTELLYIGGEDIIAHTINQKDNTLFLGDITLKRKSIPLDIKEKLKNISVVFSSTKEENLDIKPEGYYAFKSHLNSASSQIKTFKYLETYRLGLQFQHITGKWSDPVWVGDFKNESKIITPYAKSGSIYYPTAKYTLNNTALINKLKALQYVKVRPIVVYPDVVDRECVCQGVLCPTVYNMEDRYNNSPTSQSSWFTRPNCPFDERKSSDDVFDRLTNLYSDNSRGAIIRSDPAFKIPTTGGFLIETVNYGANIASTNLYSLASSYKRNGEIQSNDDTLSAIVYNDALKFSVKEYINNHKDYFFVDKNILSFHSPEIQFNEEIKNMDTSSLKLRIVGIVPMTSSISDIDIQTSTPPNFYKDGKTVAPGFYKETIGSTNISKHGYKGLSSGIFWLDSLGGNAHIDLPQGLAIYPWHGNGSLNGSVLNEEKYLSAKLDKKKMSTSRFSINSFYFPTDRIWNAYIEDNDDSTGISGVKIFDSNEVSMIKIPSPLNSGMADVTYYGNIDKIILSSSVKTENKEAGYPLIATAGKDNHSVFIGEYNQAASYDKDGTVYFRSQNPIRMKYKSTAHAVLALNYTKSKYQKVLPTMLDSNGEDKWTINSESIKINNAQKLFWEDTKNTEGVKQDVIDFDFTGINEALKSRGPEYGYLWLGELYRDDINKEFKFGGSTPEAIENNNWLPCGKAIKLSINTEIEWEEGDTYYQRYDHLKTYPFTQEDQNSVVDIVSFMCETRVNIDGRYDKNRGLLSNLAINPTNFNLINPVYSQENNFFNYRSLNEDRNNLDIFKNTITWTKTKTSGELVDTWTNITLASTLDLDGDKGPIRALKRFNNELISFQDSGISNILFNSRTQLSTTQGVPVEIANSNKVDGKRYISESIGCLNKWSICDTPTGIYFIDNINKSIYNFNGKLTNLSSSLGFDTWVEDNSNSFDIWNPSNFNNFVTYYDKPNKEILFINKKDCLSYSEQIQQFTSFYSYEHTPYFINLLDELLSINTTKGSEVYNIWLQNKGDYNMFFNTYQPFSTTVIANPDMQLDKIFNTLEFRSDTWKEEELLNTTFDRLQVWNEYQEGSSDLTWNKGVPSNLKKKFRMWRSNIPRDNTNKRDRMRNPWLYIKLSMEEENTNKTVLHDLMVHYLE